MSGVIPFHPTNTRLDNSVGQTSRDNVRLLFMKMNPIAERCNGDLKKYEQLKVVKKLVAKNMDSVLEIIKHMPHSCELRVDWFCACVRFKSFFQWPDEKSISKVSDMISVYPDQNNSDVLLVNFCLNSISYLRKLELIILNDNNLCDVQAEIKSLDAILANTARTISKDINYIKRIA